jgi:hypothetical protein
VVFSLASAFRQVAMSKVGVLLLPEVKASARFMRNPARRDERRKPCCAGKDEQRSDGCDLLVFA